MKSHEISKFLLVIQRYNKIILLLGLVIYAIFLPIGVNTVEILGADLRVDNITDDQEVTSFSSLKSNIIVVVDGDSNIISSEFKTWLEIELNEFITNSISRITLSQDGHSTHIFNQFDNVLKSYMNSLFFATAIANITTYLVIDGTNQLIQTYKILKNNSTENYAELAFNQTSLLVQSKLSTLSKGFRFLDLAIDWLNKTKLFLLENEDIVDPYPSLISEWETNTGYWVGDNLSSEYENIIGELFFRLTPETIWEEDFVISLVSEIIFNNQDQEALDFIHDNFDGGNVNHPSIYASNQLIPFIRGDYNPYGLVPETANLLRTALSNSENGTEITSIIIQFRLNSDITKDQLNDILTFFSQKFERMSKTNGFGYEFAIMSLLNYQKERSENLDEEFQRLDILTIILVLIILIFWLKDIRLIILSLVLSWTTTQTAKGLLLTFAPNFVFLVDVSVSIGSALLFGAALNYTIFFAFRYKEERESNDHFDSVMKASKTAIHAIFISGTAIFLTFLPLMGSSLGMIVGLTYIAAVGILIELFLLAFLLPAVYLNSAKILNSIDFSTINKITMRGININYSNYRKYIVVSILLLILSLTIIMNSNANLSADDYVGEGGQTDLATNIFAEHYPANFFSKILVKVKLGTINNSALSETQYQAIRSLTENFRIMNGISTVVSYSHPFGKAVPFNLTLNLIDSYTYSIVRDELIIPSANEVYIILGLRDSPNSNAALRTTESLIEYILEIQDTLPSIEGISLSGFTLTNLDFQQSVTDELFQQITVALILLTLFLWYQFRSISVPLRLEITIIIGSIYALAISVILWNVIYGTPLNLLIVTTAIIILLGLGADFDIYIYSRIQEELNNGAKLIDAINVALQKSGPAIRTSGLAMAFSFLSLTTGNIVLTRQFGLVTFIAVVIDVYFIRTILVPAILLFRHKEPENESKIENLENL
ncbi:MAG: MMPL family transporter [Candidatus Heimdallarchaeota archaeon]|nr:MMPL family transporter [Candidatus Heimdallarchaeota archaeon]